MGPRAGPDGCKISPPQGFDPGPSSPQSVTIPTELPGPLYNVRYFYNLCTFVGFITMCN